MLKTKRIIIFGLLLFLAVSLNAQQSRVTAAYTFLQQGKLDSAKATIDVAILHPETQSDGQAWYVRGFIYKTIYNQSEKSNKQSSSRIEGLISFKKSLTIDTTQENVTENIKNIKFILYY